MSTHFRRSAVAVLSLLVVPLVLSAQSKTHRLYAHVVDASGAPLPDVQASEFQVTEGGVARKVVRATLGGDPMRILLLVDTGDEGARALNSLRSGLQAFIDGIPALHEIALITTGRQTRVRIQPTTDRKKLRDSAGGLFADGGGTVLRDSLLDADNRFLAKVDDRVPVFVIVSSDGTESSTSTRDDAFNKFGASLIARGATVHAVVLASSSSGGGIPTMVGLALTRGTRGRYEAIGAATALSDKLKAIAAQIVNDYQKMSGWYQVDYASDAASAGAIDVVLARPGIKFDVSPDRPR